MCLLMVDFFSYFFIMEVIILNFFFNLENFIMSICLRERFFFVNMVYFGYREFISYFKENVIRSNILFRIDEE